MLFDTCEWQNPGVDRYAGTARAAIHAFAEIPEPTRERLIAAWERRDFADSIVIDRSSIRGKANDYGPEIRSMHFGARGNVCARVTRSTWTAEHVETALVVCADGFCAAIPAVCSNWFVLRPIPRHREPPLAVLPPDLVPAELLPAGPLPPPEAGPPLALIPPEEEGPPWGGPPIWFAPIPFPFPPGPLPFVPVLPAVPEPATWVLLIAGLLVGPRWMKRRQSSVA